MDFWQARQDLAGRSESLGASSGVVSCPSYLMSASWSPWCRLFALPHSPCHKDWSLKRSLVSPVWSCLGQAFDPSHNKCTQLRGPLVGGVYTNRALAWGILQLSGRFRCVPWVETHWYSSSLAVHTGGFWGWNRGIGLSQLSWGSWSHHSVIYFVGLALSLTFPFHTPSAIPFHTSESRQSRQWVLHLETPFGPHQGGSQVHSGLHGCPAIWSGGVLENSKTMLASVLSQLSGRVF